MSAGSTVENCLALQKGLWGRELPHLLAMFHLIVVDVSISIKGHQPRRVSRSLLSPTAPWVLRALLPVSAIFVQLDPVGDFFFYALFLFIFLPVSQDRNQKIRMNHCAVIFTEWVLSHRKGCPSCNTLITQHLGANGQRLGSALRFGGYQNPTSLHPCMLLPFITGVFFTGSVTSLSLWPLVTCLVVHHLALWS